VQGSARMSSGRCHRRRGDHRGRGQIKLVPREMGDSGENVWKGEEISWGHGDTCRTQESEEA
jgi:hypothetical protein